MAAIVQCNFNKTLCMFMYAGDGTCLPVALNSISLPKNLKELQLSHCVLPSEELVQLSSLENLLIDSYFNWAEDAEQVSPQLPPPSLACC